jgi:hypothetical protein
LTSEAGIHFADLESEYTAVVDRAHEVIAGFPPLLRGLAKPLLPELAGGEFSRIVALLPYWLTGLLDGLEPPAGDLLAAPDDEAEILGLANLLGWWSYLIQDRLLDREMDRLELLPLSTALHVAAIWLLEQLLPGHQVFWETFQRLSLTSAEAHCWEQRTHRLPLGGQVADLVDLVDLAHLADRSALLQLAVVAQFALRGHDQDHPLRLALAETLRQYTIARQIGDDLADWVEDLRRGRLNYVSACTARRMRETGAIQAYVDLDVDQMVGFFLYDDELLSAIQQTALDACQRAAASLAPYESRYLGALVDELPAQLESSYEAALQSRRELRALFLPPAI